MAGSRAELEESRVGIEAKMRKRGEDLKDNGGEILVIANPDLGCNHPEKREHLDLTVNGDGELKGEEGAPVVDRGGNDGRIEETEGGENPNEGRLNGRNFELEEEVEVDIDEEKHNGDSSMVENGEFKADNEGIVGKEAAFVDDKIEEKLEDVDLVEGRPNADHYEEVNVVLEEEQSVNGRNGELMLENNEVAGKGDIAVEEKAKMANRGEEFDVNVDATCKVEEIEKEENLVVEEEMKDMGMDDKDLGSSEEEEKLDMQALIGGEEDKETGLPHIEEHAEIESQPEEEPENVVTETHIEGSASHEELKQQPSNEEGSENLRLNGCNSEQVEEVEVDIEEEKHSGDSSMVENEKLKVKTERIEGKEGDFLEDRIEEKQEDADLVEERSNADNCEEVKVDLEEEQNITRQNGDISVLQNGELMLEEDKEVAGKEDIAVEEKAEPGDRGEEFDVDVDKTDKVEEIEKEDNLVVEEEKEMDVDDKDLGSSEVEEKQDMQALIVRKEDQEAGLPHIEEHAESKSQPEEESENVVTETHIPESASDEEQKQQPSNEEGSEDLRLNGCNDEQEEEVEVDVEEEKHNDDCSMVENGELDVESEGIAGKDGTFLENKIEEKREDADLAEKRSNVDNCEEVKVNLEEEQNITGQNGDFSMPHNGELMPENKEVAGKEDIAVEEKAEPGDIGEEFVVDVDATGKVEEIEKEENLVVEEEKKEMGVDDKDLGSSEVEEKRDMQDLIVGEEDQEVGLPDIEGHAESQPEEESVNVVPETHIEESASREERKQQPSKEEIINVEESELSVEAEQKLSFDGDALTNETGDQLKNDSTNFAAEVSGGSLEYELNHEAVNIRFGSFEGHLKLYPARKELVEEINDSTIYKNVEVELVNRETIPSECNSDITFEDRTENKSMASSIEGGQCTNKDDEYLGCEATQVAEMIQAPPEARVVEKQSVYMIKVPRIIDDELQKEIRHARSIVDEKTQIRDSISEEKREQLSIVKEFSLEYNAELAKVKDARAACRLKRQELEKVKEKLDKLNNANSIADIDEKIRHLKHRQQHETISLKQEKQYIQEINRMTHQREQLSLKQAAQEQIDESLNQRDDVEAQLKKLKKELESLKAALSSTESNNKSAWNKHMAEQERLNSLKEKYFAADGARQKAYQQLTELRKQSAEKARHFQNYKSARSAVDSFKLSGDNQGLISYCNSQVEGFFDLWNNDKEFRDQYVKSNTYSTLKRLDTLDGRSLGVGEERPIFRPNGDRSLSNTEPAPVSASEVSRGNLTEPSLTKQLARTNKSAKLKSSAEPAFAEDNVHRVSISGKSKEEEERENKHKKEEEMARKAEELARKEEELRKEKEATELKERLRLEQRAKAREAEERKRRKAEKAQERAEYRLQKEAEAKEKNKAKEKKKARKEKKKAGLAGNTANEDIEVPNASIPDANPPQTSREAETSPEPASERRPLRPRKWTRKHDRVQDPLPSPLRNRSKRKMSTWMWVLLVLLLVFLVFFAGNYISFSTSGLPSFGF